jgi:hypothetical protein
VRNVKFRNSRTGATRRHYLHETDVLVVLSRLPENVWARLRAVHFNDRSVGCRRLGYAASGRREIAICALPQQVSLSRFVSRALCTSSHRRHSPREFGAVRGYQWPGLAVRRFMLYEVFLHELGHLQIIDPTAKRIKRRFASETKAQEFADYWRAKLWSKPFDHPDPIHNPPTLDEFAELAIGVRDQ